MTDEYDNFFAAEWARQNLTAPVVIKPIGGSTIGKVLISLLCFFPSLLFISVGVVAFALGARDRATVGGSIFFGVLMLIPSALIVLLGWYVRRGFASTMDHNGIVGAKGQFFHWSKLYYIDHVTKHIRAGRVSRQIKNNQLELVFENGKVIIPPLIADRERIWELIGRIPAQNRDDGVTRH